MNLKHYVKIARPDHWVKQIFVLPGIVLAFIAVRPNIKDIILPIIIGLIATCFIASANYTINEWLDRELHVIILYHSHPYFTTQFPIVYT